MIGHQKRSSKEKMNIVWAELKPPSPSCATPRVPSRFVGTSSTQRQLRPGGVAPHCLESTLDLRLFFKPIPGVRQNRGMGMGFICPHLHHLELGWSSLFRFARPSKLHTPLHNYRSFSFCEIHMNMTTRHEIKCLYTWNSSMSNVVNIWNWWQYNSSI